MGRVSMPQGKGSQLHNRRDYDKIGKPTPDNIDVSKSSENITLVDKDIRQAYGEIFGAALAEYNDKQKRADRKIESYYDHIQKSKNGEKLFYEDVVQWGKAEDFQSPETRERAKEALVQYVEGFEARNPNLKLIGAYIHMDEASPHLHLDYIPVAAGYSRGLAIRNSLDKAMKQMGYRPENESRKNNATKLWKENERAVFGEICRSYGLEVEPERKARGSLSVEEYKEARDEMLGEIAQETVEARQELSKVEGKIKTAQDELNAYSEPVTDLREMDELAERAGKTITGKVTRNKKDDKVMVDAAKHGVVVDMQVRRLEDSLAHERDRNDRLCGQIDRLEQRNHELRQENAELKGFKAHVEQFLERFNLVKQFREWRAERQRQEELERQQKQAKTLSRGRSR